MTEAALYAQLAGAALTGVAAGGHCLGMCGGLQAALMPAATPGLWRLQCGRSLAYVLLGALAGGLGAGAGATAMGMGMDVGSPFADGASGVPTAGLGVTVDLLRVAMGVVAVLALLSLAARLVFRRDLLGLERFGAWLWRLLQPLARRAGQWREPWRSYALGMVWAFIPCGLVLSMAALATTTGAPWRGAALLGAFALGTWPALLGAGAIGSFLAKIQTAAPSGAWYAAGTRWVLAAALVLLAVAQVAFLAAPHHHHPGPTPREAPANASPSVPAPPPAHHHHTGALPGFRDGGEGLTLWARAVRAPA